MLPRLLLLDEAVQLADARPDLVERAGHLDGVEQVADLLANAGERVGHRRVRAHDLTAQVAVDHRQRAAGEVAVFVRELARVALLESLGRHVAVLAERHLAHQVEAQRVGPVHVDHLERIDHVPERLGHLVLVHQQVAEDVELLRQLELGSHQQGGPDDRVELQDVLCQQLDGRRPEALDARPGRVGQRRVVVEQRVEPDVEDL